MTKPIRCNTKHMGPAADLAPFALGKAMCTGDLLILWDDFTQAFSEVGPEGNGLWSSEALGQLQVWFDWTF